MLEDPAGFYDAKHQVSVNDIFDNRFIFGDNLLALKASEVVFNGKVKCVFIDPPYNTHSAFTCHDDSIGAVIKNNALKMPVDIASQSNASLQPSAQTRAKQQLTAALLERLVALNATRAMEEKSGTVRWLRPDYQAPHALDTALTLTPTLTQGTLDVDMDIDLEEAAEARRGKPLWPSALAAQIRALADLLDAASNPVKLEDIARIFGKRSAWQASLVPLLESLEAMGRARRTDDDKWMSL